MISRALTLTLAALAIASPTALAQTCLRYNVLTLKVIYHDVCVSTSCMNNVTFMPDFELPSPYGYADTPMTLRNGYVVNYCAAITGSDIANMSMNLRPWGCNNTDCSNPECYYTDPYTGVGIIAGLAPGMVKKSLGHDLESPMFSELQDLGQPGVRKSIASENSFWNWYHTDSTSTIRIDSTLNLTRQYDDLANNNFETFVYKNDYFFPLDGLGYSLQGDRKRGDDWLWHNFGFTTRIHSDFYYNGGEHFTFQGDDDVWVFMDGQLAIDIGGIHDNQCRSIRLDDLANGGPGHVYNCVDYLHVNYSDIRPGEDFYVPYFSPGDGTRHRLDIFHAERHSSGSHFAMSTSLSLHGTTGATPAPNQPDYTAPSPLYTKLTIHNVDSNNTISFPPIYPDTCGTLKDITIGIPIAPIADTLFRCRILDATWVQQNGGLDFAQAGGINANPPPFNISTMISKNAQATWARIDINADHTVSNCLQNSDDNQTWNFTVHATSPGSGYLYCLAENKYLGVFNDYTAIGVARGQAFHTKWAAAFIAAHAYTLPPTQPPPTQPPTQSPSPTPSPTSSPTPTPSPSPSPSAQALSGTSSPSMSTSSAIGLGVAIGLIVAFVLGIVGAIAFRKFSSVKGEKHVELEQQQRKLGVGDSEQTTQPQPQPEEVEIEGTSV